MSSEMPEWPKPDEVGYAFDELSAKDAALRFQRAMKEAYAARLRVAVDHINHSPRCAWMQPVGRMECDCGYREALDAIGPLPPRPNKEQP